MFWGMNLKPNRKYSQTTAKSFHISQAALDPEVADDTVNKIYISGEDNQKYLICTLRKNICEQVQLDLNFAEGDPICFQTIGSGNVTLSGYLVESSFFGGGDDDEGSEEEEDNSMVEQVKALLNGAGEPGKKKKDKKAKAGKAEDEAEEDSDSDEDAALNAALESDDDEDDEGMEQDDSDDDEEEDDEEDDDEEEEDDDEDDDDEEEEVAEPKKKMAKIETGKQQQNGEQQKSKKDKKAEKQQQTQQQQQKQPQQKQQQQQQQQKSGEERTLTGGVKVVDLRVGNGEEAKQGKRAHVYYEGRLKSNNKVFDSLKNGAPFKFKIGQGEVIKAWDIGVAGMKIGGKRRIICPPHMAYGSRGSPPAIPPNSTLVFEVELKSVSK